MVRSIATIVSAILLSNPGMPKEEATRYATALQETAKEHDFDPLTAVAIIHFETHFRPSLISADGEDYGLGQVRGRFLSACRDDEDPVGAPSEECKAAKESLLDGVTNIRRMGQIIAANRDLCMQKNKSAKPSQWLAGYQGYNDPGRNRWCKPGPQTWKVLGYAKELVVKVAPGAAKAKAGPATKPSASSTKTPERAAKPPSTKAPSRAAAPSNPAAQRTQKPSGSATRPRKSTTAGVASHRKDEGRKPDARK